MILDVLRYPHKMLRNISREVSSFDCRLHTFLDDMYETMIFKGGVGLAAIQVGRPIRILLINVPNKEDEKQHKEDLLEVINPEIVSSDGEIVWSEGCLSVPGFYEEITRFNNVRISYMNRHGEAMERDLEGFEAVVLQHELDHLNGILFIDKLSFLKRKKFEKELRKNGYKVV